MKIAEARKIEKFALATGLIHTIAFLFAFLNKRFHNKRLRQASWLCYLLVPISVSYTLGLMGNLGRIDSYVISYLTWGLILLYAYAGSDNLSIFSLDETGNRLNFFFQILVKMFLFLSFFGSGFTPGGSTINTLSTKDSIPLVLVIFNIIIRIVVRFYSMAGACAASPVLTTYIRAIIDHMNEKNVEVVDPINMEYLVGLKCSKYENGRITDGITVKKILECNGKILRSGDPDGQIKDTCLSFALFWLLLGKIWGYPLYEIRQSKLNAWKLIQHELLANGRSDERVFKVIEVELSFLQEYFYSNYYTYYWVGTLMKLCAFLFFLPILWLYAKGFTSNEGATSTGLVMNGVYTKTLIWILMVVEVFELIMFMVSKWYMVGLLCLYTNKTSPWCIEGVVGAVCRISMFISNRLLRPWKRELDQYSLLESCTSFGVAERFDFEGSMGATFGIPIAKPGRKLGSRVAFSKNVKRAVVQSLCRNTTTDRGQPKLSNGVASLGQNGVENLLSWACKLEKDVQVILVWHIATCMCEMNPVKRRIDSQGNFEVAVTLSKYCAYLLSCAPLLLPVPLILVEYTIERVIEEARELFQKRRSTVEGSMSKYEMLRDCYGPINVDTEGTSTTETSTLLQKGVKLGLELESLDEGERWKILAELWAEMILYLAPSNSNETVHAKMLADGGEFITHLWALLIHAGIVDREDLKMN